jgi:type IV secretory pathway TraG/TraD family ATPase VirD4
MSALTHGTNGLLFAYACALVPMMVALIRERARVVEYFNSLWMAVVVMVIVAIVASLASALLHHYGMGGHDVLEFLVDSGLCVYLSYTFGVAMARYRESDGWHRRGAVVSDAKPASKPGRPRRADADSREVVTGSLPITLAGIPVAAEDETKHFKFIGTTGTGKSTAIREMLSAALARGDRVVIADPDGGYLSHFYNADRGDVILNPFDPDSVKWNLLGEIRNDYDVDQLARSLIPDSGGSDRIWSGYARTFFTAVVQQVIAGSVTDDGEIYRLVTKGTWEELKLLLAGTVAGPFMEDGNEKMFGSVRSVTSSAIGALKYTVQQRAAPFSVRQWIRQGAAVKNGGRGGVLFMPYKAGEIAALRSSISAWMRIAIFEAMDGSEGDQRLWFVVDELDALGEIDGLKDALARLRKFGGRCVLGFQSISQVSSTYGKGVADTIVENCGSSLILRCSASEQGGTSQFASRLVGQREVVHLSESKTWRPGEWSASRTRSEQRSIEPAVMASEIERLPDLQGFLKFASIPDWLRVSLTYVKYPTIDRPTRAASATLTPEPTTVAQPSGGDSPTASASGSMASRAATGKGARKSRTRKAQSSDALPEDGTMSGEAAAIEHADMALRAIAEKPRDDANLHG